MVAVGQLDVSNGEREGDAPAEPFSGVPARREPRRLALPSLSRLCTRHKPLVS